MRLTAATIRTLTLPPGKSDHIFFDADLPGFGLRVRATGGKTWMVQYAIAGRTRRMVLGPPAVLDPGKARETAKDSLAQVRLGRDPASEKNQARTRAEESFGALLKPFMLRQQDRLKPHSLQQANYNLFKLCRELHTTPIAALSRKTIAARLATIATTNGPATSNRTRANLSAFCTWAAKEGYLDVNPVSFTNVATENGARERLLTDAELVKIWNALDGECISRRAAAGRLRANWQASRSHFGVIIKLLILTGLRRTEIGYLSWSEIDLDANLITLPGSRTKNGKSHLVPMSGPVRALIEEQPRQDGCDFLFSRAGGRRFENWSSSKQRLDDQIATIHGEPVAPWVIHDFRRKFSTDLHEKLHVPPHICEVLLGHIGHQSGVAGVYNRSAYLAECARALDRWADHIVTLVPGNSAKATVIPLRAM